MINTRDVPSYPASRLTKAILALVDSLNRIGAMDDDIYVSIVSRRRKAVCSLAESIDLVENH